MLLFRQMSRFFLGSFLGPFVEVDGLHPSTFGLGAAAAAAAAEPCHKIGQDLEAVEVEVDGTSLMQTLTRTQFK